MSGQLILIDHKKRFAGGHASHDWHAELPNKHTRLIFDFGNTERLYFNDMRKFGWCKLLGKEELTHYLDGFGPDAIPDIDLKYLKERAARMPRSSVKKFILDQKILGGVGNIYTDESLFDAWINPKTLVSKLTDADWGRLKKSIIETLNFAIEKGGTTDSDYVNANGESGGMQDFLRVYHKAGEPCAGDCGGVVKREVVAGRGTYYCPSCQKEKK